MTNRLRSQLDESSGAGQDVHGLTLDFLTAIEARRVDAESPFSALAKLLQ
jgi:hypothetical protein